MKNAAQMKNFFKLSRVKIDPMVVIIRVETGRVITDNENTVHIFLNY
jgi:uncharacterized membrane-anchored protein